MNISKRDYHNVSRLYDTMLSKKDNSVELEWIYKPVQSRKKIHRDEFQRIYQRLLYPILD